MDEGFNNIEELLKETLDGYKKQPSPKVWKTVSLKLFFRSALFYASVFLLLLGIGVVGYFYFHSENTVTETYNVRETVVSPKTESNEIVPETINIENNSLKSDNNKKIITEDKIIKNKVEVSEIIPKTKTDRTDQNISAVSDNRDNKNKQVKVAKAGNSLAVATLQNGNNVSGQGRLVKYPGLPGLDNSIDRMVSIELPLIIGSGYKLPDYLHFTSVYSDFDLVPKDDYGRITGNLAVGAFITPEVVFLNDEGENTKRAISLDITGVYGDDFFLEAGVGVSLSEDNGQYKINYSQYDSIGYFYHVNSFEIDPVTGDPIFKTTLEGLYDTVDYQTSETTNNLYTYLRIPVYAGYEIRQFNNLSIYIKAGGVYSVLVNSYEPGVEFTNNNATSIIINDETPRRIHSYFKLSASVGLSYKLSESVSLSLEPVYNYYMQPVYERRLSNKSPWSLGLRFGVMFKIK